VWAAITYARSVSSAHHDSSAPPATTDGVTHPVDTASAVVDATGAAADLDEAVHAEAAPRGTVMRLYDRFAHLVHEVSKFGAVGIVAFIVDLSVFNVLNYKMDVESLTSATISMALGATVAFVGNRFWTWRHRERSGLRREYSLYFFFNTVGLLIALACLAISTYGLGAVWPAFKTPLAENISKMIVGGALGTIFRFWSYRTIVFREVQQSR
jgi:putative flippase GtrA